MTLDRVFQFSLAEKLKSGHHHESVSLAARAVCPPCRPPSNGVSELSPVSVHRQKDRPQTITRSPQVRVNLEKASKPPGRTSDEVPLEPFLLLYTTSRGYREASIRPAAQRLPNPRCL